MRFDSVVGYTYNADTYCPACVGQMFGLSAEVNTELCLDDAAIRRGIDRLDEHSYDSSEFPKVIFSINVHSGDEPDYCGRCHELLAPYECSICGDEHGESAHGEPLVMRDQSARTVEDSVIVYAYDALDLVERVPATGDQTFYGRTMKLINDWNATPEDQESEFAAEYLDDIDSILSDAGYLPVTNADQGTWSVYAPTVSDVESAVGTG